MSQRQGDDHAPGAPDAPLRGDVLDAGGHHQDDAGSFEVGAAAQEGVRHPLRHAEQVTVDVLLVADHQGGPLRVAPGGAQEREVRIVHAMELALRARLVSSHQR